MLVNLQNVYTGDNNAIKHVSLTRFFRRRFIDPSVMQKVIQNCKVSNHAGSLPPELVNCIKNKENIPEITDRFIFILDVFLKNNINQIKGIKPREFRISEISRLFNTECIVETRPTVWEGAFSYVVKLSFKELNCSFAVKIFKNNTENQKSYLFHNPEHEIAIAFNASRAEPKNYNRVFIASVGDFSYMVSRWLDVDNGINKKQNLNRFYCDSDGHDGNYRQGYRIDFGGMSLLKYGELNYKSRKIYRTVVDIYYDYGPSKVAEFYKSHIKNYQDKMNWDQAISLMSYPARNGINKATSR